MKHVAAFQPSLATPGPTPEEWDRLPWLFDEPKRVRHCSRRPLLAALALLAAVDAAGSYQAGRLSALQGWALPSIAPAGGPGLAAPLPQVALSADETRAFAQRIFAPVGVGWYRKRANAAY